MTQALYADFTRLKHTLLEVGVPVVGVQTAADFWQKNLEKYFDFVRKTLDIPHLAAWLLDMPEIFSKAIEKHVFKTNFESFFDIEPPFQLSEAILTGSLSEGLFLFIPEPPDMDFMCVLKNIRFSQEDQQSGILLLSGHTPFVYAFITNKEAQNLWREFLDEADNHNGENRLSSRKMKEKLKENYQKMGNMFLHTFGKEQFEEVSDGAAVTITKHKAASTFSAFLAKIIKALNQSVHESSQLDIEKDFEKFLQGITYKLVPSSDIVLAISCDGWPSCAQEWIPRERRWPDKHSVTKIAKAGYHIVPKSSQEGDFRLSFSCAETKLVQTLSPLQHKVMRAFKAVVKYNQHKWTSNFDEIISSYHLKTIAFWYFEKTPQESWTEETLVHHLISLPDELADGLRNQCIPMYFMPKVNLLKNCDNSEDALEVMEKISQLCQDFSALFEAVNRCVINDHPVIQDETDQNCLFEAFETFLEEKLNTGHDMFMY